jgi:hypothetical protein
MRLFLFPSTYGMSLYHSRQTNVNKSGPFYPIESQLTDGKLTLQLEE